MLLIIRAIAVGASDCRRRRFVRVNDRFSIGVAMLMLVVMLMHVLMSKLMSTLSKKLSNILRNWDGHCGGERAKEIRDGQKPPQPSPRRPPQANHLVINPITARYIAPFRPNANRQRYDKFTVQPLVELFRIAEWPGIRLREPGAACAAIIPRMTPQTALRES
jgi:hypothetical protein